MLSYLPTLLLIVAAASVSSYSPQNKFTVPQQSSLTNGGASANDRRRFLDITAAAVFSAGSLLSSPAEALAAEDLTDYKDDDFKFGIKVPANWERTVQSLPDRRKLVLYIKPDSDQKTLVFFAYTPLRSDFTSLGSFGSVDEVAQATILPKSTLAGVEGVSSKMLSAESKKQAYFFDYLTKVPQQPETHFRTIFSLAQGPASASNVLVSITAQTPEANYEAMKPLFDEILESYK